MIAEIVRWLWISSLLVAVAAPNATRQPNTLVNAYDHSVATAWFDRIGELVRDTPGFTPPVASRAMGYAGVALYEALLPGMPGQRSLVGQVNDLERLPQIDPTQEYHWPSVANSVLAAITRRLFAHTGPAQRAGIDGLERNISARYEQTVPTPVMRRSIEHGRLVAAAIFAWSKGDGGHEGYMFNFPESYVPRVDEGLWEATPPDFQRALQPYWGENRPFVLDSGTECLPPPPPAYSTDPDSALYQEAWEIYDTVTNLAPWQREIALDRADDPMVTATPPGHSLSIATQVLREENVTLDQAAITYALLGMALADAFVAGWHAKYHYNQIRPITYIQRVIDPQWNGATVTDPVETPPFPEYPSGHSVEAGAAATVLAERFGEAYTFTDHTNDRLGMAPRTFPSFWAAAEEAAVSRLYGGIHYRSANERGLDQGRCVAERVLALELTAAD